MKKDQKREGRKSRETTNKQPNKLKTRKKAEEKEFVGPTTSSSLTPLLLSNFRPHVFKNPKKFAKKQRKPKKYVLDTFVSFLAFSVSSQKNLKFQTIFLKRSNLTHHFQSYWFFLFELTLMLFVFKKLKNTKK
jgi:hypothetical protein